MLIAVPQLLDREAATSLGARLAQESWVDGNETSGAGAALAKRNRQLPEGSVALNEVRQIVQRALSSSPLFLSAALPKRIFPPLVNRYGEGESFGAHVDNAIRVDPQTGLQMRTDLSATLFLTDPGRYDGGDLTVEGTFGEVSYKLDPGDLLLYPSTSLHRVTPVLKGERISVFFWIESLVRDGEAREVLFDMDKSIQALSIERGADDREVLRLTRSYHNLVRRWAG